jgi:hypothetical protein
VSSLAALTTLNFGQRINVTDEGMLAVSRLIALTHLYLSWCYTVTAEGLRSPRWTMNAHRLAERCGRGGWWVGTRQMDVGVGSFVLANAVLSRQSRGLSAGARSFRAVLPLLALGFARLVATTATSYQVASPHPGSQFPVPGCAMESSRATPQAVRGWDRPPCTLFKIQSCYSLGSAFEEAAFQTLTHRLMYHGHSNVLGPSRCKKRALRSCRWRAGLFLLWLQLCRPCLPLLTSGVVSTEAERILR